jgi:hypothetical protein
MMFFLLTIRRYCYSYNPPEVKGYVISLFYFLTLGGCILCCAVTMYQLHHSEKRSKNTRRGSKLRFFSLLSVLMGFWRLPSIVLYFFVIEKTPPDAIKVLSGIVLSSEGAIVCSVFMIKTQLFKKIRERRLGTKSSKLKMDDISGESKVTTQKSSTSLKTDVVESTMNIGEGSAEPEGLISNVSLNASISMIEQSVNPPHNP